MARFIILVLSIIIGTAVVAAPFAYAVDPEVTLEDPKLEARAKSITMQLRCPTCVSQSVDSSNVGISRDLQVLVRERILAGDSDREILDYVASRYGDFVLLRPRTGGVNIVLWTLPVLVFLSALGWLIFLRRRNRSEQIASPLTAQEQDAVEKTIHRELR